MAPVDVQLHASRRDAGERRTPIYEGLAPLYDRLVGDALFPAVRAGFDRARRALGLDFRSVADIGCGTGRFLRHLAVEPVALFGVDASPAVLRVAARRLQGREVVLLRQDIRALGLPQAVDLITCNGDTLNYLLRPEELAATLCRCHDQLTPGGHLVGDLLCGVPWGPSRACRQRRIVLPGLISCWSWRALPERRMTCVVIRLARRTARGWRRRREVHWQRWPALRELRLALVRAGLELRRLAPLPTAAGPGGRWLQFVARRATGR